MGIRWDFPRLSIERGEPFVPRLDETRNLKNALYDELDTNFHLIEHKKNTIERMIVALQEKRFLPGTSVHCACAIYSAYFSTVLRKLNPIERDNIENIYGRMKINDEFMDRFEETFRTDYKGDFVADPWAVYEGKLRSILEDYEITQELIKALLDQKPVDIYYRKSKGAYETGIFVGKVTPDIVRKEAASNKAGGVGRK